MKSFRLYTDPKIRKPTREVADYSEDECDQLQKTFEPLAAKYRQKKQMAYLFMGGFVGCSVIALLFPWRFFPWFAVPIFLSWLCALLLILKLPRLVCTGCNNDISKTIGKYCPMCGDDQLQPGSSFHFPRCSDCGKFMKNHKGNRIYLIQYCTHCGLLLYAKGV